MSERLNDEQKQCLSERFAERFAECVTPASGQLSGEQAECPIERSTCNLLLDADAKIRALRQQLTEARQDARTAWLRVDEAAERLEALKAERHWLKAEWNYALDALRQLLAERDALRKRYAARERVCEAARALYQAHVEDGWNPDYTTEHDALGAALAALGEEGQE